MRKTQKSRIPNSTPPIGEPVPIEEILGPQSYSAKRYHSSYDRKPVDWNQLAREIARISECRLYPHFIAPGRRAGMPDPTRPWIPPGGTGDSRWEQLSEFCDGVTPSILCDNNFAGAGPHIGHITPAVEFIDPKSDYGFKYLFGSEPRKEFLISLLQNIFKKQLEINDIVYQNTEHLNNARNARSARFDIRCTSDKGDEFIIEMQRASQRYFKDRANYYTGLVSSHCAKTGNWNYELPGIHFVGIMDFSFEDTCGKDVFTTSARYDFPTYDVSSPKQIKAFLQLPEFKLKQSELKTDLHRWMYLLKHLETLKENPVFSRRPLFKKFLDIADISTLSKNDHMMYKKSLEQQRNEFANLETATEIGKAEGEAIGEAKGEAKGKAEIIKRLLVSKTLSVSQISDALGMDQDAIEKIEASLE